jgi:hypothetical protein
MLLRRLGRLALVDLNQLNGTISEILGESSLLLTSDQMEQGISMYMEPSGPPNFTIQNDAIRAQTLASLGLTNVANNRFGQVSEMAITSTVSSSDSTGVEERHQSLYSFSKEVATTTVITEQGEHVHGLLLQVKLSARKVKSSEIPTRKTTGIDGAATTVASISTE